VHLTKRKALFLFFRFLSPSCLHSYDSVFPLGRGGTVAPVDLLLSLGCGREGVLERQRSRDRERETSAALVFFCSLCSNNNKKTLLSPSCTPRSSFLDASPAAVCFRLASNLYSLVFHVQRLENA
jgi:hypothetical protein